MNTKRTNNRKEILATKELLFMKSTNPDLILFDVCCMSIIYTQPLKKVDPISTFKKG